MSYRREALEDAGLFDERFRWKEDDELAYRVMKRGWSIVSDSEAAVYHPVETLSLNELFKRGLKHQYDVLFYKKHPDIAVAYFRLLKLGPVAITPIFLFIIGVLCTLAALMEVAFNEVNISIPLVSCSAFLFAYVYLKSRHKELKISFFWMAIFAIFMEIGRILGCLRFRKILL
jgi:GT2 family glycosyltransferase